MIFQTTRDMLSDKIFLKKTFTIALPVAMQGMLNTVVNLVDTLMIGTLGDTTIAAVGLANKVFFVFNLLIFGIMSGTTILAAQYYGNGDMKNVKRLLGLGLVLSLIGTMFFAIPSIFVPQLVMRIFTVNPDTIQMGASYLWIVAIGYPFSAVTNIYVALLRATQKVKLPVFTSCVAIAVNVFFNALFIFEPSQLTIFGMTIDIFGFGMGAPGAAIATLIARMVETVLIVSVIQIRKYPIACKFAEMMSFSKNLVQQFIHTATPVVLNEFMWGLGVTLYSLAYGRMGDQAVAAITIATTIQDISVVFFQGVSSATAVILGSVMGAGRLDTAETYAKYFFRLQFMGTLVCMALCYCLIGPILSLYNISELVAHDTRLCILVFILYMPVKMFNYINIVGVLRSGGDTKMCLFLDTSGVWLIGVPLAFLGGLVWKLPIYVVYALVFLEEIYKMIFGYMRYRQKKWLRNLATEI